MHGSAWGKVEPYLWVFPRQGYQFRAVSGLFEELRVLHMLDNKAYEPPIGGRQRVVSRLSVG